MTTKPDDDYDKLLSSSDEETPFVESVNEWLPDRFPILTEKMLRFIFWGVLFVIGFGVLLTGFSVFISGVGTPGDGVIGFDAPGVEGEVMGTTSSGLLVDIDGQIQEVEMVGVTVASSSNPDADRFGFPDEEEYRNCVGKNGEDADEFLTELEGSGVTVNIYEGNPGEDRVVRGQVFVDSTETVSMLLLDEGLATTDRVDRDGDIDDTITRYEDIEQLAYNADRGVWNCPEYDDDDSIL